MSPGNISYVPNGVGQASEEKCTRDYVGLLRQRIEKAYDLPFKMLDTVCTKEIRGKKRETGYGWLKFIILDAYGKYLPDGGHCDLGGTSACDLYVRMHIDGKEVFNTRTVLNEEQAMFYEMYRTDRVKYFWNIQLNLRDEDYNVDDSLVRLNCTLLYLDGYQHIKFKDNYFNIIATWRIEYEYENIYKFEYEDVYESKILNQILNEVEDQFTIDGGINKNSTCTDD